MVWISCRWDILTAILEAQKQRVARQGIEMEKIQVSSQQQQTWKSDLPKDGTIDLSLKVLDHFFSKLILLSI